MKTTSYYFFLFFKLHLPRNSKVAQFPRILRCIIILQCIVKVINVLNNRYQSTIISKTMSLKSMRAKVVKWKLRQFLNRNITSLLEQIQYDYVCTLYLYLETEQRQSRLAHVYNIFNGTRTAAYPGPPPIIRMSDYPDTSNLQN